MHLSSSFTNSLYYLFVIYCCLLASFWQTIAKKIKNSISRFFLIYKIIIIYFLIVTKIIKINIIATIVTKINTIIVKVIIIFVVANKIKYLN